MAFPWPGKKESQEPAPKREFPASLDPGEPAEDTGRKAKSDYAMPGGARLSRRPAAKADGDLQELAERLGQMGQLLDQTREELLRCLVQRQSQAVEELNEKLDVLAEMVSRGGDGSGRAVERKLDSLNGKLADLLESMSELPASRGGGEGAAGGVSESAVKAVLKPLGEKLDQIDEKIKTINDRAAAIDALKEAFVPTLVKVRDGLSEQHGALHGGLTQLQQQLGVLPQYFEALRQQITTLQQHTDSGLRQIIKELHPPEPEKSAGPAVSGDWQEAVLGDDLASDAALAGERQKLFADVLSGNAEAAGLVGQLLVFRASPPERKPPLLKDIGEAYYRWRPRTNDKPGAMEKALAGWLQQVCDRNSIELVHPGVRFDSQRHNASKPGVEITQVLGWIVLREDGKVYSRAAVAVK